MTEPTALSSSSPAGPAKWSPWRTIVAFGFVSMVADMVYEGMRSISGPYLASLGASAALVGLVTGAGEAMALILRLVAGPLADRTHRYWALTIVGYGMTAVCVPLLAFAPLLGGAGLAVASTLILLERTGKAIRSPSKSALLALAAKDVGRGKGFGVHKSMDQVGAFAGPLIIAAAAALSGHLWLGLALMAIPGVVSMVLLFETQAKATLVEEAAPPTGVEVKAPGRLPWRFHAFAVATSAGTGGLMTYGVIAFHLVDADLLSAAATPVVYAGAMAVAAVAALGTGVLYDRFHEKVLYLLPVLVAMVPAARPGGTSRCAPSPERPLVAVSGRGRRRRRGGRRPAARGRGAQRLPLVEQARVDLAHSSPSHSVRSSSSSVRARLGHGLPQRLVGVGEVAQHQPLGAGQPVVADELGEGHRPLPHVAHDRLRRQRVVGDPRVALRGRSRTPPRAARRAACGQVTSSSSSIRSSYSMPSAFICATASPARLVALRGEDLARVVERRLDDRDDVERVGRRLRVEQLERGERERRQRLVEREVGCRSTVSRSAVRARRARRAAQRRRLAAATRRCAIARGCAGSCAARGSWLSVSRARSAANASPRGRRR
jgi:MFS family permease